MPLLQLVINFPTLLLGVLVKMRFFKKNGFGEEYKEGLKEGWRTRKNGKRLIFGEAPGTLPVY